MRATLEWRGCPADAIYLAYNEGAVRKGRAFCLSSLHCGPCHHSVPSIVIARAIHLPCMDPPDKPGDDERA